ncbi:MAG TPA: hypothetical protein EYM84_05435 [Flavobacteriales bacterium]|nr:hypothetical protein [Flavobacteriales bacterium]HIN39695.1 hypothetical protein [Flavobacteriales bacterium]
MKNIFLFCLLFSIAGMGFTSKEQVSVPSGDFCNSLKTLLEAAKEGFDTIKGPSIERIITGHKKNYYLSNIKFVDEHECYINDVASYPECECILATDTRISDELTSSYNNYKSEIENCLGEEWTIIEQDSSNNYYLKGTKYRKLVVRENITGKKVKFHLFIYSSMIEKKRVVELKVEGIGKK